MAQFKFPDSVVPITIEVMQKLIDHRRECKAFAAMMRKTPRLTMAERAKAILLKLELNNLFEDVFKIFQSTAGLTAAEKLTGNICSDEDKFGRDMMERYEKRLDEIRSNLPPVLECAVILDPDYKSPMKDCPRHKMFMFLDKREWQKFQDHQANPREPRSLFIVESPIEANAIEIAKTHYREMFAPSCVLFSQEIVDPESPTFNQN